MSTYSSNLRIELITTGTQAGTWGNTTNDNYQYILEQAIAGSVAVSVTSANQALTYLNGPSSTAAANQSVRAILSLSTTTGANFAIYAPPVSKQYLIYNTSSYTATIYNSTVIGNTTAAGVGVAIPAGAVMSVWSDGTNFYQQNTYFNSPTIASPALTGTPTAPTAAGGTNTTQIATTAFVGNAVSTATSPLAPLASPSFSGVPTAPTAAFGTNTTQLATTAFVQQAGLIGEIKMWSSGTAPTGYLLCNGAAVSRTTYASLFAVVGTTWGAGDGSTTFNLPDFRDRFPVGAGTTYSANSQGGSKDAIVVSHTHTVTDPGHSHSFGVNLQGPYNAGQTGRNDGSQSQWFSGTQSATTGISLGTTGSSGTNANLPPYLGIYFIIKT